MNVLTQSRHSCATGEFRPASPVGGFAATSVVTEV